jgi:hypothetical protein
MGSVQWVSSLRVVIKAPAYPAIGVVAPGAIAREAAFVVTVLVTAGAGARCILEGCGAVTFFAWHNGMTTD